MYFTPTESQSTGVVDDHDVEGWPRDFDFRMSRAEQQELVSSEEGKGTAEPE